VQYLRLPAARVVFVCKLWEAVFALILYRHRVLATV
jgi:hypothetical protein